MMSDLKRPSVFRATSALTLAGAFSPGVAGKWLRTGIAGFVAVLVAATSPLGAVSAQDRPVPDTFEATTTGMTPEGLTLKLDVLQWSDDQARADVVAALAQDENAAETLAELPSAGVVWRSGSAVGHSIKYAFRETLDDGSQRVTVVTDKPLDAYSFEPWEIPGKSADEPLAYSVIELTITADGNGRGTMAPAAEIEIDAETSVVSLREDSAATVLTGARELPKPYWARTGEG